MQPFAREQNARLGLLTGWNQDHESHRHISFWLWSVFFLLVRKRQTFSFEGAAELIERIWSYTVESLDLTLAEPDQLI
jgi:hypothetical protein